MSRFTEKIETTMIEIRRTINLAVYQPLIVELLVLPPVLPKYLLIEKHPPLRAPHLH